MSETRQRGCLKTGCLGCAGAAALVLVGAAALLAIGVALGPTEQRLERPELARELPHEGRVAAPTAESVGSAENHRPVEPAPSGVPDDDAWRQHVGLVELDLTMGRFELVAGKPGEPIRVEGQYDAGSYELVESMESDGETGWAYRVRFHSKVSWLRRLFNDDGAANRLRLVVPPDVPFRLEGRIGVGESELELGGLFVVSADLDYGVGSHDVGFHLPVPEPMERFRIAGSVGEVRVFRLGNASPRSVRAANRVGPLELDLNGRWQNDSEVVARGGVGEFTLLVPDDVSVIVEDADVGLGETDLTSLEGLPPAGEGRATLSLEITAGIGEVSIRR
jgi:hypothetical protein